MIVTCIISTANILIILSIVMTEMDKYFHSLGSLGRFLVVIIYYWTPIDLLFLSAASSEHLLNVCYTLMIGLHSSITFAVVKRGGISIFKMELFPIGYKTTSSRALIAMTYLLILSNFAWLYTLNYLMPQATRFGTQTFCNGLANCASRPDLIYTCQINSPAAYCIPTVFSTLYSRILFTIPYFGSCLQHLQLLFIVVTLIGIMTTVYSKQERHDYETDRMIP